MWKANWMPKNSMNKKSSLGFHEQAQSLKWHVKSTPQKICLEIAVIFFPPLPDPCLPCRFTWRALPSQVIFCVHTPGDTWKPIAITLGVITDQMSFSPSLALHCLDLKSGCPSVLLICVALLAVCLSSLPFSRQNFPHKGIHSSFQLFQPSAVNLHSEGKFFQSLGRLAHYLLWLPMMMKMRRRKKEKEWEE